MKTAKSWFQLVMAFLPVLFCGGLLLYFNSIREMGMGLLDGALGPTMIGLAAFGLLFLILFVWKLRRLASPPAPPKGGSGIDAAVEEARSDFDPDAAMARYLARRGSGTANASPAGFGGEAVPRPPAGSFGRKGTFQ